MKNAYTLYDLNFFLSENTDNHLYNESLYVGAGTWGNAIIEKRFLINENILTSLKRFQLMQKNKVDTNAECRIKWFVMDAGVYMKLSGNGVQFVKFHQKR